MAAAGRGCRPEAGLPIRKPEKRTGEASLRADDRVLRAKYLDWCSAQVADHFLALSPTEIFELAERAARDSEESGRPSYFPDAVQVTDVQSYKALVEQVTEVLWQQLDLPAYETWIEMYRADPAAVEEKLLGFWREES